MRDPMKPTMTLAEYVKAEAEDGNLFWRLPTGDHLNLLDAALEEIDDLRELLIDCETERDMYRAQDGILRCRPVGDET